MHEKYKLSKGNRSNTYALFMVGLLAALRLTLAQAQASLTVWPGDANNNGQVNNVDMLYLGLGYNFFGPARSAVSTNFTPQSATPWNFSFFDGANFAHADCNGDGLINFLYDAFPIYVHYGRTHGIPTPDVYPLGVAGIDPELSLPPDTVFISNSQSFTFPLHLGSAGIPAENIYGIAFSIHVDPMVMDIDDVAVDMAPASWFNNDGDRIFSTYRASDRRLDVALTRTDRNARTGHGPIGTVEFVIIDDVVGLQGDYQLIIDSIKVFDPFGNSIAVAGDTLTLIPAGDPILNTDAPTADQGMRVSPNPAGQFCYLYTDAPVESAVLFDALGRQVAVYAGNGSRPFPVSLPEGMPAGRYIWRVHTSDRRTHVAELIIAF
jgi:hypothetical protein